MKMKTRGFAALSVLLLSIPLSGLVIAADMPTAATTEQAHAQVAGGYLGVMIGSVPDATRAQLGDVLPSGQGVMIHNVVDGSPAAKAGLKPYDILIDYGDQKLYSAEQLSKLVRADRPDSNVKLKFIHRGTLSEAQVALGKADSSMLANQPEQDEHWMYHHHDHPYAYESGAAANWDSFDSLALAKQKDGKYKADVQYFDKDHKLVKQSFTGSIDMIRKQILAQKSLPKAERNQLLGVIDGRHQSNQREGWVPDHFFPPHWFN
jgi:hypothetical protein